ncbi:MAG: two-component sensor histidine kinase [Alphaproteobacteria bacterium]|nr:two-component sensor histidine kinase [Alphaproteobacteria bacterium]
MTIKQWIRTIRKTFLPNGLLGRFFLIILLPLIVVQLSLGIFFYNRHWDTISHRLARDIYGEIEFVTDLVNTSPDDQIKQILSQAEQSLFLDLKWTPGRHIQTKQKTRLIDMSQDLTSELKHLKFPYYVTTSTDGEQRINIQLDRGVLEIVVARKRFFSTTVWVFFAWMLISSVLWFGVALIFMKNQLRAIIRLAHAAEAFGIGKNVDQFKPEGATEVRHAGAAFLMMKNRLQRYLSERTAMLAGVSHDLRTPLTRLKLQLSMMPSDETTRAMEQDLNEMENMLNGYLTFARGDGREDSVKIELTPFMTNLVDKFKKTNHAIELNISKPLSIIGRPTDLSRALGNLIANAGRYATKTWVKVTRRQDMVQIIVDDNGPGIPKNKRKDVFKPFVRLEPSRNQQTGGVGLGLTISRDILLSHGGDINLDASPMKGLRVIVNLPLYTQKD